MYNFILAVAMRQCLGKHSCMISTFPIAILNGICSLHPTKTPSENGSKICKQSAV